MDCKHLKQAAYIDDNGIERCWICDVDLRTSEGDI